MGETGPDHRRDGLGHPGHVRSEDPQEPIRGVGAHLHPHRHPGRQAVDIGLTQRRGIRVRDGKAEHRPAAFDLLQRHTDRIRGGAQGVALRTGLQQDVTGQSEEAAAALGVGHLVHGETEARQVLEQPSPRAWISDPRSLHGVEVQGIDHLDKCASRGSH